jgi:hypothetical protein
MRAASVIHRWKKLAFTARNVIISYVISVLELPLLGNVVPIKIRLRGYRIIMRAVSVTHRWKNKDFIARNAIISYVTSVLRHISWLICAQMQIKLSGLPETTTNAQNVNQRCINLAGIVPNATSNYVTNAHRHISSLMCVQTKIIQLGLRTIMNARNVNLKCTRLASTVVSAILNCARVASEWLV